MFKKCDISRNEVLIRIRRVASITSLKGGITKEVTLRSLSGKFILAKSEYWTKQVHPKTRGGRQKRG